MIHKNTKKYEKVPKMYFETVKLIEFSLTTDVSYRNYNNVIVMP